MSAARDAGRERPSRHGKILGQFLSAVADAGRKAVPDDVIVDMCAAFDAWLDEVDPDKALDDYALARLFARDAGRRALATATAEGPAPDPARPGPAGGDSETKSKKEDVGHG